VLHEPGFWANGEDVTAAVEAEAWKQDNMDKLAAMSTDEAHLFGWVDYSRLAPYAVLTGAAIPVPIPRLPPSLDVLWVAPRMSHEGHDWRPARVWKLSRGSMSWLVTDVAD
jgi:hypothetical protein